MRYRPDLTLLGVNKKALYQPSLWGDTYLTPQEARVYLQQMLMTLKKAREKKNGKA